MELNLKHQALAINKNVFEVFGELPVDVEITLPDYCPDIAHMLKCCVTPQIDSKHISGERLEAEGVILSCVHYCDERGIIKTYEVASEFSKSFDIKDTSENDCVFIRATVDYVNYRAVSSRKIEIHGSVTLAVRGCRRQEFPLISDAEGGGLELRRETKKAVDFVNSTEKFFLLDEVVEIGPSRPQIQSLIMNDSSVMLHDYKIINNKLILKGEVVLNIVYSGDLESPELETMEASLPVSQILELDQVDDECICDVELSIEGVSLKPRSDAAGEVKNIAAEIRIKATASAYRACEIPLIEEAYSTECETDVEAEPLEYLSLLESRRDTFLVKKNVELPDTVIQSVMRVCCRVLNKTFRRQGSEVVFSGAFAVNILACDENGMPLLAEKPVDFEYRIKVGEEADEIVCSPIIMPVSCSYLLTGSNQIEVKVEAMISANIFALHTEQVITGVNLCEDKMFSAKDRFGLTIYFAEQGESVWEIAKKYRTTSELVMNENDLAEDVLAESRMLLIPCA